MKSTTHPSFEQSAARNCAVAFLQGVAHAGNIYLAYTSGPGDQPRGIEGAIVTPAPRADRYYIWPRSKELIKMQDEKDAAGKKKVVRTNPDSRTTLPRLKTTEQRKTIQFSARASAGVDIDPVDFAAGQSLEFRFETKVLRLQPVGRLVFCSLGDRIPIRLGMPVNPPLITDISRRAFLHRSAGILAASAGLAELARAETLYGVETPELRSRAEVEAVLGKAPKPAAEASLRPLTILLAGGAKDHLPKTHSHDVLPKRWKVLLGGAGPGDEAVTNMYRPQAETDRALIAAGSPRVKALSTLEWPTEEHFATADVIVLYQHPKCLSYAKHQQQIEAFLNRGGGLVLAHYVLWNASPALADLLGLAKGKDSQYKHKVVRLKLPQPHHPIMRGLVRIFRG